MLDDIVFRFYPVETIKKKIYVQTILNNALLIIFFCIFAYSLLAGSLTALIISLIPLILSIEMSIKNRLDAIRLEMRHR